MTNFDKKLDQAPKSIIQVKQKDMAEGQNKFKGRIILIEGHSRKKIPLAHPKPQVEVFFEIK